MTRLISSNPLKLIFFGMSLCQVSASVHLGKPRRMSPSSGPQSAWLVEAQWPPRSAHTRFVAMPHRRWGARTPRHAHSWETQNTWLANASSCGSVKESADGSSASSISAVFMRSAASTARPQPMACSFHTAFVGRDGRERAARDMPRMGSAVSPACPQPMTCSFHTAFVGRADRRRAARDTPLMDSASTARPQPMTYSLSIASKQSTFKHSAVLMRPAAGTARPLRRGRRPPHCFSSACVIAKPSCISLCSCARPPAPPARGPWSAALKTTFAHLVCLCRATTFRRPRASKVSSHSTPTPCSDGVVTSYLISAIPWVR